MQIANLKVTLALIQHRRSLNYRLKAVKLVNKGQKSKRNKDSPLTFQLLRLLKKQHAPHACLSFHFLLHARLVWKKGSRILVLTLSFLYHNCQPNMGQNDFSSGKLTLYFDCGLWTKSQAQKLGLNFENLKRVSPFLGTLKFSHACMAYISHKF